MPLSLRNDQKFIHSVILYEVNNWTPIDRVCENLRKLADNGFIPKSNSLPELSVKSITKFVKEMDLKDVNAIQKDQNFIRSVLLYEFLISEKDKDKIYKKMLRRIGSDLIFCPHFSHWFYQFKNGNYNFDDDSLYSESPTFSDLPIEVLGKVIEKSDLKEQLSLRKVSRNLRSLVDEQKPAYKIIRVHIRDDHILVKFNGKYAVYCDEGLDLDSHRCLSKQMPMTESSDYVEIAFNDVANAMKNPKLQLESLSIDYLSSEGLLKAMPGNENATVIYEKIENLLETLNHKISVKEFSIMTNIQHQLMSILPFLKPGVLEVIGVCDDFSERTTNLDIDKMAVLEQWKYAKNVTLDAWISSSIQHFLHFKRFMINLNSISTEDLIRIRDEVLTSNEFQKCDLKTRRRMPSIVEIERIFGLQVLVDTRYWRFYHCPIPNSNEFFQFKVSNFLLCIERISRNSADIVFVDE